MTKISQEIIAKAVEAGGWPDTPHKVNKEYTRLVFNELEDSIEFHPQDKEFPYSVILWEQIALDKHFWVALGKSLGWGTSCWHYSECGLYEVYRHEAVCGRSGARARWEIEAERFYHLILQEKDTTVFWQEILGSK